MTQLKCQYFQKKLSFDYLDRLKANTDLQVSDTEVPGYHLRYSGKTGRKVLYINYTLRFDGMRKERNLKLGVFPEISAPEARAEAIKCRGQVLEGTDPMLEREKRLRETMSEQEKRVPFKVVMERYLNEFSKVAKKPGTSQKEFQMARKHILPLVGNIPINELNIRDVEKMHLTIGEHTKTMANHCLMLMSYFLNWCIKQEIRPLGSNPVRMIKKFETAGRDRVYSDEEYQRIFEAIELGRRTNILNPVGFDIVEFIIFTGCRSGEAKHLVWSEVDFDNSIMRLKKSKTGAKSLPIGRRALEIVRAALPNKVDSNSPVFPNANGKPWSEGALYKIWDFIRQHAKLEDANVHDLRHSFATTGSMTGENMAVVGKVLGHSAIQTTNRYTHINNPKAVEAANNIAEVIACKGKIKKKPTANKLRELAGMETIPETRGRKKKNADASAPKKHGRARSKKESAEKQ